MDKYQTSLTDIKTALAEVRQARARINKYINPKERFHFHWAKHYICKDCSNSVLNYIDNKITNDIKNKTVPIEKKYNLRPSKKRVFSNFVKRTRYLMECIEYINLDKISYVNKNLICNNCSKKCTQNKHNQYDLASILIKSIYFTKLYTLFCSEKYKKDLFIVDTYTNKTNYSNQNKFINITKLKLLELINENALSPIDFYWKGAQYYYKQLFEICSVLDNIVPIEVYKQRNEIFLNDYICGHPMASNGWFQESLQASINLGCIDM